MAEGFALADAFVRIRATTTGFRAEADAGIKAQMAGAGAEVKVGASTAAAQAKLAGLRTILDALVKKNYAARLSTEDTGFQASLAKDLLLLTQIDKRFTSRITLVGAQRMEADLLGVAQRLEAISGKIYSAHVMLDEGDLEGRLALLITQLSALGRKVYDVRVQADPRALPVIQKIISEIGLLQNKVDTFDFNLIDPTALRAAESEFGKLDKEVGEIMPESVNRARTAWLGFWNVLGRNVPLFGGIGGTLGFIAFWHLLADAIIETVAVLIPAGIAFAAFAAGAVDATQHILLHMQSLSQVTAAFGQNIAPLAKGGIRSLEEAINPHVYELFGQAIQAANDRMRLFSSLARGAAQVLDQLGARAEIAITSSGFQVFLQHAVEDLAKIGDIIGNIFGIVGNLLKSMYGWAEILLQALDIVSRAIENFTALPVVQTMLRWAIGLHGFWVWVGLATTGVLYMIPILGRLTGGLSAVTGSAKGFDRISLATRDLGQNLGLVAGGTRGVIPALKNWTSSMLNAGLVTRATAEDSKFAVSAMEDAGAAGVAASRGTKLWAVAWGALKSVNPWVWVGLGVVALGALATYLATAKDSTQQWVGSLQETIDKTATWANVTGVVANALAKIDTAVRSSTQGTGKLTESIGHTTTAYGSFAANEAAARVKGEELRGAQTALSDEFNQAGFRLGEMAQRFGGLENAMGLARIAGIKVTDMLHANRQAFANDMEQISGLVQGYKGAGVAAGALGNAVQALQVTQEDQVTSVQRINQAWTQFLQIVQGGDTTFVTFAQDMLSANKALAQTGGTARTVIQTFNATATATSRQADAARRAHVAFNGLNAQSLQLRSTWNTSITAAQSYYEALSTQSAAASDAAMGSRLLARAGGDLIAILAPAAKGSNVMKQSILALGQQFGFSAQQTQFLINHASSLKANEKDLQVVNDQLAQSVSNVGRDWAKMADTLQSQVKSALDAVALKESGAAYAGQKLYEALHQQGPASAEAHNWYLKLITDLHNAGLSWQQAKDYAGAYTKGIGFNAQTIVASASARAAQIEDLTRTGGLMQQVGKVLDQYSAGLKKNADQTQAGRQARLNLVSDLENIGLKAHFSQNQIDNMIAKILKIPKSEVLNLLMHASGHYSITGTQEAFRQSGVGHAVGPAGGAAGMRVPGSGNRDSFPAMLTPGEAVVPKHLVPNVAPFLSAHKVPGFASGGYAGSGNYSQAPVLGAFQYSAYSAFKNTAVRALADATYHALTQAQQAASATFGAHAGPGGGAPAANAALARRMYPPWASGAEWIAWNAVAMRESGWNQFAYNPSGAFGIPQSLPYTKMPRAAWPTWAGGSANPAAQIGWMIGYIKSTYGDPIGAWNSELTRGFYDAGGWLPPGMSMAYNGTGQAERVVGPGQDMKIALEIHSGASPFEAALAEIIRKYVRVRGGDVQQVFGHN